MAVEIHLDRCCWNTGIVSFLHAQIGACSSRVLRACISLAVTDQHARRGRTWKAAMCVGRGPASLLCSSASPQLWKPSCLTARGKSLPGANNISLGHRPGCKEHRALVPGSRWLPLSLNLAGVAPVGGTVATRGLFPFWKFLLASFKSHCFRYRPSFDTQTSLPFFSHCKLA